MITVPLFYGSSPGSTDLTIVNEMVVRYSYIPASALGEQGAGNKTAGRVHYSYAGTMQYSHGGLSIEAAAFDTFTYDTLIKTISYPDDWLELHIEIEIWWLNPPEASTRLKLRRHTLLNGPAEGESWPHGFFWRNAYTVPEENHYIFDVKGGQTAIFEVINAVFFEDATGAYVDWINSFSPFTVQWFYGDGTEETFEVPAAVSYFSPYPTGISFDFTMPEPKEYAPGVHIDYPYAIVTNAHGQQMRPIYYDLYPTGTLDADDGDTTVNFTLNPWDFEDELDNFDIYFGDGTGLTNQPFDDLALSHDYATEGTYTVTVILRDRNTPDVYLPYSLFERTVIVEASDHPINALTDPFGCLYAAVQVDSDIQVFTQRGGATRENLYLLTGHRAPSIYRAGGSQLFLMARDLADGVWRVYLSNDCGENFTLMAEPFGGDTDYKKVRARGTAEGGGIATALKDGWLWFVHSWDNDTWGEPVQVVESTEPGDVHQQSAAGSSRLVIVLPGATYVSNTADGAAGSWELMP